LVLPEDNANTFDHKTIFQVFDPFHLDGIVLGNVTADIDTDLAGFTPVHRNIGGFVLFTVVDTVGFRAIRGAKMTIGLGTNVLINISNVIHDLSNKRN